MYKICCACMHVSINFFLVSTIETTYLNQSGPILHEVFIGTESRMSSIMSEIHPVTWVIGLERLKIAVFWPCWCNRDHISQSIWTRVAQGICGHKILDEFDNDQNPPSNTEFFALELLKIAALNLVGVIETWFPINLDQTCLRCLWAQL